MGDPKSKLDWKFPVGAGLLGFPGGPSHFQGSNLNPQPSIVPVGLRRNLVWMTS
jgi:hypothetical protein